MKRTGIPINFGITVVLGFVVGCAIAGQTFYLFTIENLKQFGSLKAMGVSNLRLVGMILLQALVVGVIGYGLGVGGAALFGYVFERVVTRRPRRRSTSPGRSWPSRPSPCWSSSCSPSLVSMRGCCSWSRRWCSGDAECTPASERGVDAKLTFGTESEGDSRELA